MENKNLNLQRLILVITCGIVPLLVFLRDIQGIDINKFILVILIGIVSIFFLKVENIIILFCFLIPFLNGIAANYIIIALTIGIMIKSRVKINLKIILMLFGLLSIELINNIGYSIPLVEFTMYSIYLLLIMTLLSLEKSKINNTVCIFYYACGTLIALTIIFINSLSVISFKMFFEPAYRFGNVLDLKSVNNLVLTHDQNFVGYLCIIGISSLIVVKRNNENLKVFNSLILYIFILFLTMYGFLTASRAFLVSFAFLVGLYVINNVIFKRSLRGLIVTVLSIGVLYIAIANYFPGIIDNFINRFSEEDITGGRTEINNYYLNLFMSNLKILLFGTGIFPLMEVANYSATIHNATLQILVSYGICGSILFLSWYSFMLKEELKSKAFRFEDIIPHLVGLLIIQSIPFISPYYNMLPLLISVFAFRIKKENIVKKG